MSHPDPLERLAEALNTIAELQDMERVLKLHIAKLEPLVQAYFSLGSKVDVLNGALEAFAAEQSKANADDLWHAADQLRVYRANLDEEMRKLVAVNDGSSEPA